MRGNISENVLFSVLWKIVVAKSLQSGTLSFQLSDRVPVSTLIIVISKLTVSSRPSSPLNAFLLAPQSRLTIDHCARLLGDRLQNSSLYAIGPLSVCLSCLSVTLVYCGQTVGWINVKLGTEVGLGPGNIVFDGDPAPA